MRLCTIDHARRTPTVDPAAPEHVLTGVFAEAAPELTRRLFGVLGNWDDAHDAAQTAFLKCWRCRDRLAGVHDVRAWVFRIGLNAAFDGRRQAGRRRTVPLDALGDVVPARSAATPEAEALHGECLDLLRAALHELRPGEREVFLLRQQADLTYDEIAATRGQPVGTVKTLMRAALRKLRERFADHRALYDLGEEHHGSA
jgi:RNA polymerase sigma-70 factor (ECF subfamily)